MRNIFFAILLLASVFTSITVIADETPYNKGVNAWRLKDYVGARKHWTQSIADGGPDEALNNLAFLLYNGLGGDAQPEKAVELWRKAAALSVSEAQWHLGQAHEKGRGAPSNLLQAYAWYRCAIATAGKRSASDATEREIEKLAAESARRLGAKLSKQEREQAEAIARELIAKYAARLSVN